MTGADVHLGGDLTQALAGDTIAESGDPCRLVFPPFPLLPIEGAGGLRQSGDDGIGTP